LDPLIVFALLVAGIIALPGMDMAFVLGSALAGGRRAGFSAVAGIVAGGVLHVAMGTLGVGLLLQVIPGALNVLLVAGAAYITWLAFGLWRAPATLIEPATATANTQGRTFVQALMTCLLNPKAYLFMVAVFPQFLRADRGPLPLQALVLGGIIAATQLLIYGSIAFGAATFRNAVARSETSQVATARSVSLLLGGTAIWTLIRAFNGS
jgi:threonine/homoserine/homoserine lactone efflux protein